MRNPLDAVPTFNACEQLIQLPLFPAAHPVVDAVRAGSDPGVASTELVTDAVHKGASVAIVVSGGKDSSGVAFRTIEYLDAIGHHGPRLLIHSDLGRVEWRQSLPICEQLSQRLGVELVVVRRQQGDLLDRLRQRWSDNVRRYAELSCVRLILPWPSARMRFCTGELKVAVICRELVRRFPGKTILPISGIRREESGSRAKAPIAEVQPKLSTVRRQTAGFNWHPIIHWRKSDVLSYLQRKGFALHEAYREYGSSRVSCAFCILSSQADLVAAARCTSNTDVYCELVRLEVASTFSFQSTRWLADVAPHLLAPALREGIGDAKRRASIRETAEARIPHGLLYVKGWPTRIPTIAEAEILAEVRRAVAGAVGIEIGFTTADSIRSRYEYLLSMKTAAN